MRQYVYLFLLLTLVVSCNSTNKNATDTLQFEQKEFVQSSDNCMDDECTRIRLSVPVITNESHEIAAKINQQLIAQIDRIVAVDEVTASSATLEELTAHYIANYNAFKTKYPDETLPWKAEVEGDITFYNDDLLSIALEYYTFAGGAYGFKSEMALNFNPKTGEPYKTEDLIDNWEELQKLMALQLKDKMDIWTDNNQLKYPESIFFYEDTVGFLYNAVDDDAQYNGPTKIDFPKASILPFLKIDLAPKTTEK
ncbi:PdaC/SigV domain-containing protein [Myroides sp. C15-4]|uniref:PdaC/SigV domain-containing protein n=1 Tax=Myroides sp. C15-4 TaxID=3400532 RepID=UPI003D2F692B